MPTPAWARAALAHPCFTGITRQHLGDVIAELADPWTARHEAALARRRGQRRRRAAGAGPKARLAFCDRVLVTLVSLRLQFPHQALAVLYGVDRSTITRAVHEVRPLLATRGFAIPDHAGVRLRTLADVVAYAQACGVELRIDATEIQVRRPRAHRVGRRAFVSGKRKQNTIKTTTISDGHGRTLWCGAVRPGRMHDQTAVKTEGIGDLLAQHPGVRVWVDEGYRGLATAFPGQVHAPPRKPAKDAAAKDAAAEEVAAWKAARSGQSSRRISVEHAVAEHKHWRRCSAGSAVGRPSARPTWQSPGWSPTEPPTADHRQPDGSSWHALTPIAHQVVRGRRGGFELALDDVLWARSRCGVKRLLGADHARRHP